MARLARDKTIFLATAMWYQYFGTKELRSVKVFTQQGGISRDQCTRVCPLQALKDYIDRTCGHLYRPADLVYNFQHVFMSQVPDQSTGFHFLVGAQTCSKWMRLIMDRIKVDPKYKGGGSIGMATASAAIDRGVPIDVVLNTGRWSSWQVFNKFYNRARLRDVAPGIGLTSLA